MAEDTEGGTGEGKASPVAESGQAPLIPLRDVVILPGVSRELFVGRSLSLAALRRALDADDRSVALVSQRDERRDLPGREDLHEVGCLSRIERAAATDDGVMRVSVVGAERIRVDSVGLDPDGEMQVCGYTVVPSRDVPRGEAGERLRGLLLGAIPQAARARGKKGGEEGALERELAGLGVSRLADRLASMLEFSLDELQEVLETPSVARRADLVMERAQREMLVKRLETRYRQHAREGSKLHREDYLKDKVASIQKALGDSNAEDMETLKAKVAGSGMSAEAREKCLQEIGRLASIPPMSPESSVLRGYIETLLGLPWKERSEVNHDLVEARRILDEDHKGLDKVKDRIIEYLAVQELAGNNRGSVLCFLGAPGVGKTSLGRSIARATGRAFVRLSLGGIHDEATIRGHRRTYVASMPGRILQSMADAKVKNPVFMLDEIEKVDSSVSGDPMAALLEVIDPEQNHAFSDHYAEVDYDLSEVMFIATANERSGMYPALRDRMEFIELPGYTDHEKAQIARRHLIPKQLEANGIPAGGLKLSNSALQDVIRNYTKEAGVRSLERNIAKVCRKTVLRQEREKGAGEGSAPPPVSLGKEQVREMLGVPLNFPVLERANKVGIVNGLAVVGDWEGIVHQIDAVRIPGDKGVKKTGNLKPHIEQTIDTAVTIIRASPSKYGVTPKFVEEAGVHIHYPNIDITHDGNSNGLAVFALLVSVLNDIPVRMDTALTGAINLRGEACAVGGLRAKLVGAWRERIARVLVPYVQVRELADVPREVTSQLEVIPVRSADEAIAQALARPVRQPGRKEGVAPAHAGKGGARPAAGAVSRQ